MIATRDSEGVEGPQGLAGWLPRHTSQALGAGTPASPENAKESSGEEKKQKNEKEK